MHRMMSGRTFRTSGRRKPGSHRTRGGPVVGGLGPRSDKYSSRVINLASVLVSFEFITAIVYLSVRNGCDIEEHCGGWWLLCWHGKD